jgi:tellurium resistance protein TerD
MSISLTKGANVSLTQQARGGLSKILVGLGWDERATDGAAFDLDAVCFICGEDNKVRSAADFIFYNQLTAADGSVEHTGDNTTGEGDGDDESLIVDLSKVNPNVGKLVFCVTIHDAATRQQNFGMISNAFVRVVDQSNGDELARFDLSEDMSIETAMIFSEIYLRNNEWKFKAVGQGFSGGLSALANNYGVPL